MHWIYLICFTLLSAGLLALFQVRPRDFTDVIFNTGRKTATLSDELNVLMGTPARGFFNQDYEIRQILKDTGPFKIGILQRHVIFINQYDCFLAVVFFQAV